MQTSKRHCRKRRHGALAAARRRCHVQKRNGILLAPCGGRDYHERPTILRDGRRTRRTESPPQAHRLGPWARPRSRHGIRASEAIERESIMTVRDLIPLVEIRNLLGRAAAPIWRLGSHIGKARKCCRLRNASGVCSVKPLSSAGAFVARLTFLMSPTRGTRLLAFLVRRTPSPARSAHSTRL